jgi:hypothetical protein
MTPQEKFQQYGALHIKDVVPKDLVHFLTHVLSRLPAYGFQRGDYQVPNSLGMIEHEYMSDTVLERVWPYLEQIIGEELLPTYAYGRVYTNGNVLENHTDRPSCEISVTVQLGRSHNYAWPIYMGNMRFDMAEGDGIIYKGCDIPHRRDICEGPEGYISGQLFLHYVRKNGPHAEWAGDKRKWHVNVPFDRNTHLLTEMK